jgi:hypothetical protein
VTRSTIARNNGGGIYLFRVDRQVTVVNNFIYRNGSSSSIAGGIYLDGAIGANFGQWLVRSNSLFGNLSDALLAAPGVHCSQPVTLTSIVLWGHSGPSAAPDCALQYSSSETLLAGLENIAGDPRFESTSPPEDLHLDPLSPCRNGGAPAAPPDDIDGDPRDVPPDIGADELTD